MMDQIVNSDIVSEKYRKYVYKIVKDGLHWYVSERADMDTFNKDDKFLINKTGQILLFKDVASVVAQIKASQSIPFDKLRFKKWAQYYKGTEAYITYNLDTIQRIVSGPISLEDITKEETTELINFINFYSDYAYQREAENPMLLALYREKEIETFHDYAYDNYMWNSLEYSHMKSLNEIDYLQFDEKNFANTSGRCFSCL